MARKASLEALMKIRERAENDLYFFAKLINPHRVYGEIHKELFDWWTRDIAKENQLVLLPRDHQKSHCSAVRALWEVTKDPSVTILYLSATATLAEKQLFAIKQMMESDTYRRYWPEMIKKDEGKRTKWTNAEIIVDHPVRRKEQTRDSTITAGGVTMNITGLHANVVFLDDMVVPNNAYTEEGRAKVASIYSQLASIETTGAKEIVVGTRYHPRDLYSVLKNIKESIFSNDGDLIGEETIYEIFEKVVESDGVFLWPKEAREDGKYFGFDQKELARKKAKYLDRTQFFAQYYNNPNDIETEKISREKFQYYNPKLLKQEGTSWYYKDSRLNVFAAIDFAFSLSKKADYTAIVVVGIDTDNNIYILEIDRFKTDGKISMYFKHIADAYFRWEFKKLRAEVTVAQAAIVKELKETYLPQHGLPIKIDEFRPTRNEGSKEERISAILEPRYDNLQIYHGKTGNFFLLEEELILAHPPHDDIKDALAAAIDIAKPPKGRSWGADGVKGHGTGLKFNSRFGGVSI